MHRSHNNDNIDDIPIEALFLFPLLLFPLRTNAVYQLSYHNWK